MARYRGPKAKLCRREGENLFGSAKMAKILAKKNYAPGIHGQRKIRGKMSDYGTQLRMKQKAKRSYNLLERQFKVTFNRALKQKGDTGVNLLRLLETRLDNVIYKAGFSESKLKARQLVNHKHFRVNGRTVNIPSYSVKPGDVIAVRENKKKLKYWQEELQRKPTNEIPGWLNAQKKDLTIKMTAMPSPEELPQNIDASLIVEFYSR